MGKYSHQLRLPFREYCIYAVAQMFTYVDPINRTRGFLSNSTPSKGELVVIGSAPPSIWGFSWVEEVVNPAEGSYVLRAIGTDQLCDWVNISVTPFLADRYEGRDDLKWYPNQYDFWIKSRKAYVNAGIDRYDFSLLYPKFEDGNAEIRFRCHIFRGDAEPPAPIKIENFEKATIKSMAEKMTKARRSWRG